MLPPPAQPWEQGVGGVQDGGAGGAGGETPAPGGAGGPAGAHQTKPAAQPRNRPTTLSGRPHGINTAGSPPPPVPLRLSLPQLPLPARTLLSRAKGDRAPHFVVVAVANGPEGKPECKPEGRPEDHMHHTRQR